MELKTQNETYNGKAEDTKTSVKTPEETAQERQFWLDAKYSDEHRESER